MSEPKITFDFTPQIFRYLEQILKISQNTFANETGDVIELLNYEGGEPKSPEIEINNGVFWDYLVRIGAIVDIRQKIEVGASIEAEIVVSGGIHTFYIAKKYLRILDITKIQEILNERDKDGVIKMRALELIAKDVSNHKTAVELIDMLKECGVPPNLIHYPETKWRMILKVFRTLSTSSNVKARRILYTIIEEIVHPLFFGGNDELSKDISDKYNNWLKYDRLAIKNGQIYIGPTDEEISFGMDDWVSADGTAIEPAVFVIYPNHLAELWVLISQITFLIQMYISNEEPSNQLEDLYLEIISKIEKLVEQKKVGSFSTEYKRPFTSLSTSILEAQSKNLSSPIILVNELLLQVSKLTPDPEEIRKKMIEYSDLIKRISEISKKPKLAEKKENVSKVDTLDIEKIHKIQLVNSEILVKNVDNSIVQKGKKKVTIHKFPAISWNEVEIRFITREEVFITTKQKNGPSDYASLGFRDDKNNKPDIVWDFLYLLATKNGEFIPPNPIPATLRTNKSKLSQRLKNVFSNLTEPFEDFDFCKSYKLQIKLVMPEQEKL